jgi:hypothetical protein
MGHSQFMAKSIQDMPKKRARPKPAGRLKGILVRLQPHQLLGLDSWIAKQRSTMTRPEALRAMLDAALARAALRRPHSPATRTKALELAGKAIDQMVDQTAPPEEQAMRKRRLIKGPKEFRELRVDRPKRK